jgi:uncharacterized protein GlcG (DUF336 family)
MLTSSRALTIALETLAEGRSRSFALLACAVLDRGGHIPARLHDENASIHRPEIAMGKAGSCLGMGFGGRERAKRGAAMPVSAACRTSLIVPPS